ncbi:hypothetical protein RIF29_18361 [Crotalaria pallida]|uniref:G-patch domain-containing protein n=1 Tax=Crotalaria pallida TaxID=3830 RepID=A0AAN9IHA5_CROPI
MVVVVVCFNLLISKASSHSPYEGAFNTFVDEINGIAAYQWWEGAIHSILSVVGYPLACSWQQCRRRLKLQRLREFVRSEYDRACLRSCRSRALYEGIKLLKKHGWKEGTGLGISEQVLFLTLFLILILINKIVM